MYIFGIEYTLFQCYMDVFFGGKICLFGGIIYKLSEKILC